jgi:hypothetical protein
LKQVGVKYSDATFDLDFIEVHERSVLAINLVSTRNEGYASTWVCFDNPPVSKKLRGGTQTERQANLAINAGLDDANIREITIFGPNIKTFGKPDA